MIAYVPTLPTFVGGTICQLIVIGPLDISSHHREPIMIAIWTSHLWVRMYVARISSLQFETVTTIKYILCVLKSKCTGNERR